MSNCMNLSLERQDSTIRASDGKSIPFARAVLRIGNSCDHDIDIVPQVSLGQEGGTVQDVSSAVVPQGALSVPGGGSVTCDVYDLLLPAHAGSASKVHMFGYRAVLNWRFELAAGANYRLKGSQETVQVPGERWTFWWSVPDQASRAVVLTIEKGEASAA